MIKKPEIDADELRRVLRVLNSLEEEGVKSLRAELKTALQPTATSIAAGIPNPPLRGFTNSGRTRWSKLSGKPSFTPGKGFSDAKNLVSIRIVPAGDAAGFFIAELAGSRSKGFTASGRALIQALNQRTPMIGKGGRYAYAAFRKKRPDVLRIATDILNKTFKRIEKKL